MDYIYITKTEIDFKTTPQQSLNQHSIDPKTTKEAPNQHNFKPTPNKHQANPKSTL
jgi:hypothetical protein